MNYETDTSSQQSRRILLRIVRYFKPYRSVLATAMIATAFVGAADSAIALAGSMLMELFSAISQSILSGGPLQAHLVRDLGGIRLWDFTVAGADAARRTLWLLSGLTVALVLVKGTVHFTKEYLLWGVTHRVLMRFKEQLFNHIVRFPLSTFDRDKSGDMLSRVTYDVSQMENAVRTGILLVKALIYALIFVTMMFLMDWSLTLAAIVVFPLSAMMIKFFGESIRRASGEASQNVADYTSFINEAISGAKEIKAFGRERDRQATFLRKITENFRHNMRIARIDAIHSPIQEFISTAGMVAVILFCGYRLLAGTMTIGDLSGFIFLLINAYKPIKKLGTTNTVLQRAIASGNQIFMLLDRPVESDVIGSGNLKPAPVKGELAFHNVRFGYHENHPVLKGIDLIVEPGETLALVGPSGAGKSTLISLIPRFYPLREGSIKLDATELADFDLDYLRSLIAVVPQETILFAGTIEENIRLGRPDATWDEVEAAAKAANADRFIKGFEDGYRSEVGERGVQLSGGQRQRIAIARAVLRDPRILLLDEATSSLDSESEKSVQEALERLRRDRTTIIIAHRLSTVHSADRIAVMVDGRLVEIGSHGELYAAGGVYRKLYEMQFAA